MGHANKRKIARRKEPRPACKVLAKASPDASARWSNLPEGPLLRMFEVMVGQDDGRSRVREAQLVCRAWRSSALEVVLGDTATSRPCRPPMPAGSQQAKPAATMNTCGAMMVGSNQSKDVSNDGMEVCSKPPKLLPASAQAVTQAQPSSSGNMIAALPCPQEEQAGSVEQQSPAAAPAAAPAVAKRGRQRREDVTPSWQLALCDAPQHSLGPQPSAIRRVTRAQAAAAAAAEQAQADQEAAQDAAPAAASVSERGNQLQTSQPSVSAAEERDDGLAVEQTEAQGGPPTSAHKMLHGAIPASAHGTDAACQHTPASGGQHHLGFMQQHSSELPLVADASSAAMALHPPPGWRRLEARVEGVFSTWSIFKRFGRRMHPDS